MQGAPVADLEFLIENYAYSLKINPDSSLVFIEAEKYLPKIRLDFENNLIHGEPQKNH